MDPRSDQQLARAFAALELDDDSVSRIEERVMAALEARALLDSPLPSLGREWLDLVRGRPAANGLLVAAATFALLITSPLFMLPLALLG